MKTILVIGGGVIGLCAAYYCARRGHRVVILDREADGHQGCSHGNAGMIVPSHFIPLAAPGAVGRALKWMRDPASPFYVKPRLDWDLLAWGFKFWRAANAGHVRRSAPLLRDLSLASRACFEELQGLPGHDFGLVKRGLLMLCKTEHALNEEAKTAEMAAALGLPAEVLDARETALLDPGVRMDIAGAVFFPKDCHLPPQRFMAVLKQHLLSLHAAFVWEAEVTGWRWRRRHLEAVVTSRGDFSADEYILCGGSWSPRIVRPLGLKLSMQAGKGYSLTLPEPRQLPAICAILAEARVAVTPMDGALRFGGTMEIDGMNETISPARVQGIIQSAAAYYPEFTPEDFAGIRPWQGLRPCSPDGLPYLGRSRKYENLVVATGHSMMGLSLGPVTGKLVGELVDADRPSIDLAMLAPER